MANPKTIVNKEIGNFYNACFKEGVPQNSHAKAQLNMRLSGAGALTIYLPTR